MCHASQYHLEKIMNWAIYLEYLQFIIKKFDLLYVSNKETLILYFWDGLRLWIWGQLNKHRRQMNNWEKDIKKAIHVEAKTIC